MSWCAGRRLVSSCVVVFVVVFVVLVAARPAAAQSIVGVKGGVQMSTLRFDGRTDPAFVRRPDFTAGLFYEFGQSLVTGQIEGLVSRRGARTDADVSPAVDPDTEILYFEIPVLLRVNMVRFEGTSIYVAGGGAIASRFRADRILNGVSTDARNDVEKFDAQWIASAGVEIRHAVIDVRYTRGILNLDAHPVAGAPKVTNDSLGVTIGYGF
jgi:hypothetical protein